MTACICADPEPMYYLTCHKIWNEQYMRLPLPVFGPQKGQASALVEANVGGVTDGWHRELVPDGICQR